MMKKEELFDEIQITAENLGMEECKARELAARIALTMKDYDIELQEQTTDLVVSNLDKDNVMVQKFLMSRKVKGCTDRTIKFYIGSIRRMRRRIQKPLKEITVDDIRWYSSIREFQDKVARVTIQNELHAMSSLMEFLSADGYIQGNPVKKFGEYKIPKKMKKAFTEYEIEKMRGVIETKKEAAFFEILLSTGCRVSELAGIRKDEIRGDKILVHGKGQKDRNVIMNTRAKIALEDYMASKCEESKMSPWLFPKEEHKYVCKYPEEHTSTSTIEEAIRRIGKKVGVQAHPHKFRRTCATFALRRGMDIIYVGKMLGHENITTTQIYLELNEEEMDYQHKKYVM